MKRPLLLLSTVFILFLLASPALTQEKIDLTGKWKGPTVAQGPDIEIMLTLILNHKDNAITGKLTDDQGYINCDITGVKLAKDVLTFKAIANTPDGNLGMGFQMTVKGDEMKGKWEAEDGVTGSWTTNRVKVEKVDLTGTWVGPAETPDGSDQITCVLEHKDGKITGTLTDEMGYLSSAPITSAKLTGDNVYLETTVSTPDGSMKLVLRGSLKGNTITGNWELPDTGETGPWKIVKKETKKE